MYNRGLARLWEQHPLSSTHPYGWGYAVLRSGSLDPGAVAALANLRAALKSYYYTELRRGRTPWEMPSEAPVFVRKHRSEKSQMLTQPLSPHKCAL